MNRIIRVYSAAVLAFFLLVFMLLVNQSNTGSPGGADPFSHFLIARWAFKYPHLFFNQWGKPIYTILVAPFTLFGFKSAVSFNIIISVLSGFLVYKSALKLKLKNAWLGIILTVFTPIFFYISFSTLTEIVFAFTLILSLYLFIEKKYNWSVIVMSFIPFARTEGIIFFPVLLVAILMVKKYRAIPLFMFGYVLMTIVGYPFMDDIWWPITTIPYSLDSSGIYGQGNIFHFANYTPLLFSSVLLFLFGVGALFGLATIIKKFNSQQAAVMVLLLGASIGYFMAHSVVWAFGLGGSAGLIRVIAGITPVVVLVSFIGFDKLIFPLKHKPKITFVLSLFLGVFMIKQTFTNYRFPIREGVEMKVVREATEYLQETGLDTNYIIYYNPIVAFLLDIDPYSRERGAERFQDPKDFDIHTPLGTVFIWDAHFAPFGNQVPKELIERNSDFIRIKDFQPNPPFQVSGKRDYEVILYQKRK